MTETTHEALLRQTAATEEMLSYFLGFRANLNAETAEELAPVAAKILEMNAEIASFYLQHTPPNILPDFGRFLLDPTITSVVGETSSFNEPNYMTGLNGSTISDAGHFIDGNDNNINGAVNGSKQMTEAVASLSGEIFGAAWHVAEVTQGAGTAIDRQFGGVSYYQSLYQQQSLIGNAHVTVRGWFRKVSGDLRLVNGGDMKIDGLGTDGIIADNNWHNFSYVYENTLQGRANFIWPFAASQGAVFQIALPSISLGRVMHQHPFNKQFHAGVGIYG